MKYHHYKSLLLELKMKKCTQQSEKSNNRFKSDWTQRRAYQIILGALVLQLLFPLLGARINYVYAQDHGNIRIETEPNESSIYLDGELVSPFAPADLENIQFGEHVLVIENKEYGFAIQVNLTINQDLSSLIIKTSFYFKTIEVLTNSENGSIEIDGKLVATKKFSGKLENPNSVIKIAAGTPSVVAHSPVTDEASVVVSKPIEKTGSLSINCSLSNAKIFVDGVSKGNDPGIIEGLSEGFHDVILEEDGYQTYSQSIYIQSDVVNTIEAVLIEQLHIVKLRSSPSGAQVFFDREFKGITPLSVTAESGQHNVRLVLKDFDELSNTIDVYKERELSYKLEATDDDEEVFYIVEEMPTFNGGDPVTEFRKYIGQNVRYPESSAERGISGRVIVQFAVNKSGTVVDAIVVRSVDSALDKEAIRLVMNSPKWTPGRQRGKAVKVLFTFPINFVLQ